MPHQKEHERPANAGNWRLRLHEIIFETDTPEGKVFDLVLIAAIVMSVMAVILESVASIRAQWGSYLLVAEWLFTVLFTIEYCLRLGSVRRPRAYAFSLLGIIDVLSFLPAYLSLIFPGAQAFLVIRTLRLLRLFRIFKMSRYVNESRFLMTSISASRPKIVVFMFSVLTIVVVIGAMMHMIEGRVNPEFDNIPKGIYWAVVTVTTVGFGDYVPKTVAGQMVASFLMILGYGLIAVPTGIVTAEIARTKRISTQACLSCGKQGHDPDARFCKYCGGNVKE